MKRLIIGLLVVCLLVPIMVLTACATPAPTNSESASRIAELEARIRQLEVENQRLLAENRQLETKPTITITEGQAVIIVFDRLVSLAQTPEAKEYVGAFLHMPSTEAIREAESRYWAVIIDAWETESIEKRDWFPDPDDPTNFIDDYWDDPSWLVYDDGRIMPFGMGLIVEAHIDRLNSYRTLRD